MCDHIQQVLCTFNAQERDWMEPVSESQYIMYKLLLSKEKNNKKMKLVTNTASQSTCSNPCPGKVSCATSLITHTNLDPPIV